MKQYLDLLRDVMANGQPVEDRTGVGTLSSNTPGCAASRALRG